MILLQDLHPHISSFPTVLLFLAVLGEGCSFLGKRDFWLRFSGALLKWCCFFVPLTYYSGYFAAEHASRTFSVNEDLIAQHQLVGQMLLISLVPTLLFYLLYSSRNNALLKILHLLFLLLSFTLSMVASVRGGELVFLHGAGVSAGPENIKPSPTVNSQKP